MKPETISKAQVQLPATREELEQKLNLKPGSSQHVVKHMLRHGYATEWGDKLSSRGTLAPILHSTGKQP